MPPVAASGIFQEDQQRWKRSLKIQIGQDEDERKRSRFLHRVDQIVFAAFRRPLIDRLQRHVYIALVDGHRIGGNLGTAGTAEDRRHFRELAQHGLDDLVAVQGFGDGDAGDSIHHHQNGAFIERGNELRAKKRNANQRDRENA